MRHHCFFFIRRIPTEFRFNLAISRFLKITQDFFLSIRRICLVSEDACRVINWNVFPTMCYISAAMTLIVCSFISTLRLVLLQIIHRADIFSSNVFSRIYAAKEIPTTDNNIVDIEMLNLHYPTNTCSCVIYDVNYRYVVKNLYRSTKNNTIWLPIMQQYSCQSLRTCDNSNGWYETSCFSRSSL